MIGFSSLTNRAKHVYAVESEKALAAIATKILALNGLQHKVTVINKLSPQVVVGWHGDMPHRANVFVRCGSEVTLRSFFSLLSETLSDTLLGEGFLHSLKHAKENLLTEGVSIFTLFPKPASFLYIFFFLQG
jgi:hypothetical protein